MGLTRAESVGRRRGDPAVEHAQQLEGQRLVGDPEPDRVPATRGGVGHEPRGSDRTTSVSGPGQHARREQSRIIGDVAAPGVEPVGIAEVHDHRVVDAACV